MILEEDFVDFISQNHSKTPPMEVDVIDRGGKVIDFYDAPTGFQIDRYVLSLYPKSTLMVSATRKDITVSVISPLTEEIFVIHHGVYVQVLEQS
jgi:hypothetical protein